MMTIDMPGCVSLLTMRKLWRFTKQDLDLPMNRFMRESDCAYIFQIQADGLSAVPKAALA